jgi:transposase
MAYPSPAWERAMRIQEVMLRALSGEIHWFQAAEILGITPRSLRRWRERYARHGYDGLLDRRTGQPSPRRVALAEVERMLQLYRERYAGFNVRHFHEVIRREHAVTLSYSYVKLALQTAGLVQKRRARGRHRLRREPRACLGELLHLDGSTHPWLPLLPDLRACLIAVPDDATSQVLHAALYRSESTQTVMRSLAAVFRTHGLPMALYTDRANGPSTPRRRTVPSTRPSSRSSGAPSTTSASSTFPPTHRRHADAANGSIARCRTGS